jgi:uncharacterized membrane protein YdbT with pleckstrin-like domain
MGNYVDQALVEGEVIIARASYHWLNWVSPALAIIAPAMLQIACWVWVDAATRAWLNYITIGLLIAGIIYFIWQYIRLSATEIAVTDRRFIHKTGWIGRNTAEIELRSIEEVGLKQTIWGRIMGYGTLTVRGTGAGVIVSEGLDSPKLLQKAIQTAQERLRARLGGQMFTSSGAAPTI